MTCGSMPEGRRIARVLVGRRVAACVNILKAPIQSIYRWKGRVEVAAEYLLLIKTSKKLMAKLEKFVKDVHSYETPEIIAIPIGHGSSDYLRWIENSIGNSAPASRRLAGVAGGSRRKGRRRRKHG